MKLVEAKSWHVRHVATHLREADEIEMKAVIGLGASCEDMREALMVGLMSNEAYAVIGPSGKAACVMGLFPTVEFNVVWLMGTDECQKCRLFILRESKRLVREWFDKYGTLGNAMWDGNELHREWAEILGFKFSGDIYQQGGLDFIRFYYRREQ